MVLRAESASLPPPILSPQVTASEAMVMLDVPDIADTELLAIADTSLVSLRAPPTQSQPPPPLPSQPPPNSASYPRPDHTSYLPSLTCCSNQTGLFQAIVTDMLVARETVECNTILVT